MHGGVSEECSAPAVVSHDLAVNGVQIPRMFRITGGPQPTSFSATACPWTTTSPP